MPFLAFDGIVIMVIAIVLITTIGNILKQKYESGGDVRNDELSQIRADLNELKKSVEEIKEYVTDLYIQQHDRKLE